MSVMIQNIGHRKLLPVALSAMLVCTGSSAFAQRYDVFGISLFENDSNAAGINNIGQIAGVHAGLGGGPDIAVKWQNGNLIFLGERRALDINILGHAVGENESQIAVFWKYDRPIVLGTLQGFDRSVAVAINDLNQIACNATGGSGLKAAFIWEDEIKLNLGTLGGGDCSVGDINNQMQAVGTSSTTDGFLHAYVWFDGQMTDLGLLEGDLTSEATAINDQGVIVGTSSGVSMSIPVVWDHAAPQALPTLEADQSSIPLAINEDGVIVGTASTADMGSRAVLWQSGQIVDLNDLAFGSGWTLRSAADINDQGWIVGAGQHNGLDEGFVLVPSPVLEVGPLIAGQPVQITVRKATPNAPTFLAYGASGFGSVYIPELDVTIQIHQPRLGAAGQTNSNGTITWTRTVPDGARGLRVLLQAAQYQRTSDVVVQIVQ